MLATSFEVVQKFSAVNLVDSRGRDGSMPHDIKSHRSNSPWTIGKRRHPQP
jgi:hypothetical protein